MSLEEVVTAAKGGEWALPSKAAVEDARGALLTKVTLESDPTTPAGQAAAAERAAKEAAKAKGGKGVSAEPSGPPLMDPLTSVFDMVVVMDGDVKEREQRAAGLQLEAVTGLPLAPGQEGVPAVPYNLDKRNTLWSSVTPGHTFLTDVSSVLDINASAVSKDRAFGLVDEALQVIAADKKFRLEDEETEKTAARRTMKLIANTMGSPVASAGGEAERAVTPVVKLAAQPSSRAVSAAPAAPADTGEDSFSMLGFNPEKRAEELKQALARGHPIDVDELKMLEVKARMLHDNYHESVVTILSKLRSEKEGMDYRLKKVGRTMLRTLQKTGGVDVKDVQARVNAAKEAAARNAGPSYDDTSFSHGLSQAKAVYSQSPGTGTGGKGRVVPVSPASSGMGGSPGAEATTTSLNFTGAATTLRGVGKFVKRLKAAQAASAPEKRVAKLITDLQAEAIAVGPASNRVRVLRPQWDLVVTVSTRLCLCVCVCVCVCP